MKPRDWRIYSCGGDYWFAWNGKTRTRIDLVRFGSFSDAVTKFEELIGDYCSTR